MDRRLHRRLPRDYTAGVGNGDLFVSLWIMEVYLLRHTHTAWGRGICYGATDVPLRQEAESDLVQAVQKLTTATTAPLPIISSPLSRCRLLAEQFGRPYTTDARLVEMNFGDWEGLAWNEIPPENLQPWMQDFANLPTPNGESMRDVYARVLHFWNEFTQTHTTDHLIVTHGGVIRSLVCHCLQIPLEMAFRFELEWGSLTKITIKGDLATVNFLNR
ncbi:MAG: alpha-ribazole phosphatase [Runella sp.]